jgi:hypothetical protein
MSNTHGTPYADDALLVNEDTSLDEVQNFIKQRVENPEVVDGVIVWNFSSHEIDHDALEKAVDRKLERDMYCVPYQVTGTWSYMFSMLPERLQRAEVLIYNTNSGRYNAYRNFLRDAPSEVHDRFKSDLAQRVHQIVREV